MLDSGYVLCVDFARIYFHILETWGPNAVVPPEIVEAVLTIEASRNKSALADIWKR